MSERHERHEIHERKSFWKWTAIIAIVCLILTLFGYCSNVREYVQRTKMNQKIHEKFDDGSSGYYPNTPYDRENVSQYQQKDRSVNDMIEPYKTKFPSNRYHVQVNETLAELAYRLNLSIGELKQANPQCAGMKPNEEVPTDKPIEVPPADNMQGFEAEVLKLTNAERAKAGLKPLAGNYEALNKSAHAKSSDMAVKGYFDHNSPTYGSPFEQMKTFGVTYSSAGENIAKGQKSPAEVVKAWMNSSGHRANILNPSFNFMGVGYDRDCWTQQFVSK